MPSPAVQTPFHPTAAQRKSRRVYVKQVLPFGKVTHPQHGDLEFTGDLMGQLVESFNGGALTQVPFVLCDDQNRHPGEGLDSGDPERFRGEVTALEQRDDGLYAKVETTERGAALLADNPTQPVSVRIITPTSGRFAGKAVLGHVAATLDEVAKHMHPWEQIEASSDLEVTDLSDGTLVIPDAGHGRPAGHMPETGTDTKPELTEEHISFLDKLLGRSKAADPKDPDPKKADEPSDDEKEADRVLAEVLKDAEAKADAEAETETKQDPEPVALSEKDRQAIDLANTRAETAEKNAAAAIAEANKQRFERESLEMKRAGIPPAAIDLARPVLEHGLPEQIDLSNGQKVDGAKIVRGLLDQMKGTIDFSEVGSTDGEGSELDEAKQLAKRMGEQFGDAPKKADA